MSIGNVNPTPPTCSPPYMHVALVILQDDLSETSHSAIYVTLFTVQILCDYYQI